MGGARGGRIGARAFVGLPNASGPVNESHVKTPLMGLVGLLVSQVPLPENPRNVTRFGQHLRESHRAEGHPFALQKGMGNSILHRVTAGHEGGPRR